MIVTPKPFNQLVKQFEVAQKMQLILHYTVEQSSHGAHAVTIHFGNNITPETQKILIQHINANYGTCAIRDIEPAQRSWIRFLLAKPAA
jgi:hypothetical protein